MARQKTFNVGDWVVWTSTSNGSEKTKAGEVVLVVPPRRFPVRMFREVLPDVSRSKMRFEDNWRDEQSYVIRVNEGTTGKAAPAYYRPRVSALSKARR